MKIAIIDPSLFTWPYDHALAEGLAENGHTVKLYAKHLADGEQGKNDPFLVEFFYKGFENPSIKKLPKKAFLALKGLAHIWGMTRLLLTLRRERPDAIHFQWTPLAVIDQFFIPQFRKIAPTVLTVHDSSPFNNNPSAALQRIGAVKIMGKFDSLIVHTEHARSTLGRYGLDPAKINRIPHGVLDAPVVKINDGSNQNVSNDDTVNMLLFGQVKPYKGLDILIEALAKLDAATKSKCRLNVVGRPQMEMQPLFDRAKELGVDDRISYDLRFIDDAEIPGIFLSNQIMVMPYREIDASGVLMISLAVGRPIIASRIGLFKELLEEDTHALLIDQSKPEELAAAITKLVNDADLRRRMGEQVKALSDSIPDWTEIGRRTGDLYRSAA